MSITALLTSGLSDALSKDLNTKFFFGALSLEEQVAALDPTAWFDSTFAKSKVAVRTNGTNEYFTGGNIIEADGTDKAFSIHLVADYTSGGTAWLFNTNGNPFINVIFSSGSTVFFDIQGGAGQMRVSSSVSGSGFKYITLTYDGSASNTGMKIYIDGVESTTLGTDNYSGPLPDDGVTISAFDGGSNFFGGDIDQCIGFNKELTATEVSEIVNSGNGLNWKDLTTEETFYDDIVTWYDFNAPSDFGKDASPNNLDLTLISIDSTNAVEGHISGKAGDWDGVNLVTDRSTNGNNLVQTTLSETPFYLSDNTIRFTGSDNLDTSANIDLSSDFTIVMRVRHSDVTESCDLISTSTTIYNNNGTGRGVVLGVTATSAQTNDTYQTVAIKSDSGTISFRLDGLTNGSGSRDATVVTDAIMTLGDTTQTQNWDLRGFFIIESALSDFDISTVEQYFLTLDSEV